MKTIMLAVAAVCCQVTAASAQDVPRNEPAARPQAAPRGESHPILLLRPDQVDLYKMRVADIPEQTKTFGLTTDMMLWRR